MSPFTLFDEPGPALTGEQADVLAARFVGGYGTPTGPPESCPFVPSHRNRLMDALRRDLDTLSGPPEYVEDRPLLEYRVAEYRRVLKDE